MNNQNLDPSHALVVFLSALLSPQLAAVAGPYAVILIACTTGAAWSLGRREPTTRWGAFWFFGRLNLTALILTVPLAELAAGWGAPVAARWLLVPIALLIGGVGDDWPAVGRFILERLGRLVDRKIDGAAGGAAGGAPAQFPPSPGPFRNRDLDR